MKTVIEMAREAGLEKVSSGWRVWTKDLAKFAELVASLARADAIADEREACAKECERMMMYENARQKSAAHQDVWAAAEVIRARS